MAESGAVRADHRLAQKVGFDVVKIVTILGLLFEGGARRKSVAAQRRDEMRRRLAFELQASPRDGIASVLERRSACRLQNRQFYRRVPAIDDEIGDLGDHGPAAVANLGADGLARGYLVSGLADRRRSRGAVGIAGEHLRFGGGLGRQAGSRESACQGQNKSGDSGLVDHRPSRAQYNLSTPAAAERLIRATHIV